VTVERGVDPRRFTLLPFGGAGPMHAAAIASELGIRRLLCPRAGGVLSALGLTVTERRRDIARTVGLRGETLSAEAVAGAVAELASAVGEGLAPDASVEAVYEMRYRGQAFELDVPAGERPDPAELRAGFEAEHERRYGYRDPEGEVELVGIRVAAIEPAPDVDPRADSGEDPDRSCRRARFGGEWVEAEVLSGPMPPGLEIEGPCVLELPESTLVLPGGWTGTVDERGSILCEHDAGEAS
jgi:N-methylhydantoinase A